LLQAVLDVTDACLGLIEQGVPATTVEQVDLGPLIRMREEAGDDDEAIRHRLDQVLHELEALA
jgi:V/A-type H+-transporting ATPase subunit A